MGSCVCLGEKEPEREFHVEIFDFLIGVLHSSEYYDLFIDAGYRNMDDIRALNATKLMDIGIEYEQKIQLIIKKKKKSSKPKKNVQYFDKYPMTYKQWDHKQRFASKHKNIQHYAAQFDKHGNVTKEYIMNNDGKEIEYLDYYESKENSDDGMKQPLIYKK